MIASATGASSTWIFSPERRKPSPSGSAFGLASAEPKRLTREQHRGQEGLRREGATERLEHSDELRHAEVRTAQRFGKGNARPAEVRHLLPELAGEAGGIGAVSERTHPGDG
jgi:hypothetical protein